MKTNKYHSDVIMNTQTLIEKLESIAAQSFQGSHVVTCQEAAKTLKEQADKIWDTSSNRDAYIQKLQERDKQVAALREEIHHLKLADHPKYAIKADESTLLDEFAKAAMAGILANPACLDSKLEDVARTSYEAANEMLKARKGATE